MDHLLGAMGLDLLHLLAWPSCLVARWQIIYIQVYTEIFGLGVEEVDLVVVPADLVTSRAGDLPRARVMAHFTCPVMPPYDRVVSTRQARSAHH